MVSWQISCEYRICSHICKARNYLMIIIFTMSRLVADKKAVQLGVSNYGPKTLRAAAAVVEKGGGKICTNQVRHSCTTSCSRICRFFMFLSSLYWDEIMCYIAKVWLLLIFSDNIWSLFFPVSPVAPGAILSFKSISSYLWADRDVWGTWNPAHCIFPSCSRALNRQIHHR